MGQQTDKILADANRMLQNIAQMRTTDEGYDVSVRMMVGKFEAAGFIDMSVVVPAYRERLQTVLTMLTTGAPPQLVPVLVKAVFVTLACMGQTEDGKGVADGTSGEGSV